MSKTSGRRSAALLACITTAAAVLAGCGSESIAASAGGGSIRIQTSFYPLQYVTSRITGQPITSLTSQGAEPHDLELTPRQVGQIADADLVIYLGGFQPAVDEAVSQNAADHSLDVATAADLNLTTTEEDSEETVRDPHFWLDPNRLSAVAGVIEERLAALNPTGAATYERNRAAAQADLKTLDGEFAAGLEDCGNRSLVTSHEAFGYLAQRYELDQVGIAGLSAEQEPTAATLASVTKFVRSNKVRTIYYETLINPAIARTVAAETGATTAVLDPIESVTPQAEGSDYLAIMRSNLKNLQKGQDCT